MLRLTYLLSLSLLQVALVVDVAPILAEALRLRSAVLQAPDAETALLRFAIAGVGMIGGSFALTAPLFALLRHHQRGALRFLGLPAWAVAVTIAGAAAFLLAIALAAWLPEVDLPWVDALQDPEPPIALAAIALMAGGALAAELLRRSVAPPRRLRELMPARSGRVEVVHPDDLRTHAG
ncbi:MAG: hypothetical protein IPJ62_13650 [Betaproteobacteria bacterium]|nr:hypothetical protein [Betaproteobacteria bacterium]